ncbi:hypothetical protein FisN_11Hh157 [Fistulifera solaris]|uniref:JmjC domain-containing protein n=1 Tax=Fistulifera solaris TaxID=1519565 RepID=A0A1Z5JK47_FISSO|nr:hypothetical protein FisN_11Hh157 [Fistulifera solaris]|eukprot:GAX14385.1 hypothetical protein FisN_11Hh157 [Fistulifera solaris]
MDANEVISRHISMSNKGMMRPLRLIILLLLQYRVIGAWRWNPEDEHPCNIHRTMTFRQVLETFGPSGIPALFPEPVILRASDAFRNEQFRKLTEQEEIVRWFGEDFNVTLSSSNSLSENRRIVPLKQYIDETVTAKETLPDQLANESWYLFGETYSEEWSTFLKHYEIPPCYTCSDWPVALAFGIGNRGSGVQWHMHGPGFSEAIHGRKHWILYPPKERPDYEKDQSSRQWMETTYWEVVSKPLECTLHPGDLIYFPDKWHHATINLDTYTVFVSAFTTEHNLGLSDEL